MTKQPTKAFLKALEMLNREHAFYDIEDGTVYQVAEDTPFMTLSLSGAPDSCQFRWIMPICADNMLGKAERFGWD